MRYLFKTLKVFYAFVTREKYWFGVFLVITIISSFLSAIIPYFFKFFTDSLEKQDFDNLLRLLFLLIFIRFIALFTHALSYYIGDKVTFAAVLAARKEIFRHVQDLDFVFHTNKSTGFLISAFKRGDGAFWSLFHHIHHRFLDIIVGFSVMIFAFSQIDKSISYIVIFSFVISLLITKFLVQINIGARRRHNEEDDKVSAIIVDNMVNYETVKLFSKEDFELERLKASLVPWLSTGWKYVNTFRLIDISIGTLVNLSVFLIIILSINLAQELKLSVGEFVLILGFVSSFYPRLFDLVYSFREVGKNYADVERYFGLLNFGIEVKDPERPVEATRVKGEIEYLGVSFAYEKGKTEAVKNINLKIRQGESVSFVGRSGSGKTTLVKLLLRFYDLDKGKITIDSVDIKKYTKSQLRSFMGVVPQEPILFNNTIGYNIAYGRQGATGAEIIAAAKIANLHAFIESLPKKYKTQVGERGVKLSGGQKQRLAIARMVLSDPEIIIFDEATSQLDSENERLIQEALWKVAKDKTTIIIAHRLSTAMRADKIVVMEKGKVSEVGSHLDLLSRNKSLYRYFWNLQTDTM